MTGTHARPKRQITPPPPVENQGNKLNTDMALPPPPLGGGSGGVLPCCTRHAPSTATKARGAIRAVMWRTDPRERGQCKEVLVGKGGRVPLPVPLKG